MNFPANNKYSSEPKQVFWQDTGMSEMENLFKVLTSEFFWGIVVGIFLSIVVAIATDKLNERQRKRTVLGFCSDMISSICEIIQNLEDNRARNKRIEHEFLEIIGAEVTVYGRNREHLSQISDTHLRKEIREFFTRVASNLATIKGTLNQFYELGRQAEAMADATQKSKIEVAASRYLADANQACDRLRDLKAGRDALLSSIDRQLSKWWNI